MSQLRREAHLHSLPAFALDTQHASFAALSGDLGWGDHECQKACDAQPCGFNPRKPCSLLAFLPHILDSGAAGRQRYLAMLRDLAAKYRERPFGFLWAQGGAQPALEASLEVGGCAARHQSCMPSHRKTF